MSNEPGSMSRRRQLLLSTALAGGLLATGGLTTGAHAQVVPPIVPVPVPLPVPVPGTKVLPDVDAARSTITNGSNDRAPAFQRSPLTSAQPRLDIDLRAKGTIIDWGGTGFNIAAGARVEFSDGLSANPNAREAIAVLNRDVNPLNDRSVIAGSLTTRTDNISVYLLNANGILFGPGASINTGSFIASTLNILDNDFLYSATVPENATLPFRGSGGAIRVEGGATLRNSAQNGTLALLAGSVDIRSQAVVNARGDVAIVAASDVSLTIKPGSPLSMTITRGTAVPNPLVVSGNVNGRNVHLAMATRDNAQSVLLDIAGTVTATTVFATDRGVVLAAGPGTSAPGVAIAAPDTVGRQDIRIAGNVVAQRAAGSASPAANVEIAARGDVDGGGAITAANLLNVAGGRDVNLSGAMNAGTGARFSGVRNVNVARATVASGDLLLDVGTTIRLDDARLETRNGDVLLTGATTLQRVSAITAGGTGSIVAFDGTLDGPGSLTTTSDGGARFDGAVGGRERLTSLTVGGLAVLNAGTMRASAMRLGALEVGAAAPADVTVDAGTGGLTIDGATRAATADANRLTLRGGSIAVRDVGVGGRFASVTFNGDTTLAGDVAAADTVRFADRLLLGAGIRRVNALSAEFGAVDAAGSAPATLSVNTTGAARFNGVVGGGRSIDLALRAGSASFAATNQVGTLAARVASGGFSFSNGRSLAIGAVDGLAGVTVDGGDLRLAATANGADLRLDAPVLASAGDLFLSAARDVAGAATATVKGSGRVELRAAGGAIDLPGAVTAGGDIDAAAGARGRFGVLTADRDVRVVTAQGLTIAGAVTGRDIALRSEGDLVAGDLTARDDVVVRAGGVATLGRLISGTGTDLDAPAGAGDLLSATGTLIGGDVDVIAAGLRIGTVRANGAGSDIRLSGGAAGIGEAAADLDLKADGSILLVGPARGTDIALSAAQGSVTTGVLRARDDTAVRAGGTIAIADAASGAAVDGQAATEFNGVADALAGALGGQDIDLVANGVDVALATASGAGGDLRITATTGELRLGVGAAGATATLTKQGSTGELQVTGSVRGGIAAANGNVRLASDTNARIAAATSATGTVFATATNEVTGVGASGRADLRSEATDADVAVGAGTLARLGVVSAGRDLAVNAGTIDLRAGDARDISLEAGGAVSVGTLRARDDVAIRAAGAVAGDAVFAGVDASADAAGAADTLAGRTPLATTLAGNDVDVRGASVTLGRADANDRGATNDLRLAAATGDLALGRGVAGGVATLVKAGADGEVRIVDGLVANGDARIESAGAARLASVTSRAGVVSVSAVGDATGGTLRADLSDVAVAGGPLVAFDTLSADGNVQADARSVLVGTATAERGALTLRASAGQLTLGVGEAGGVATLVKAGGDGDLRVTNRLVAGGDVGIESASAARLASVTSRMGSVSVTAAGEATGGALRADAGDVVVTGGPLVAFDTLSANANVRADAASVLVGNGLAERGDLTLRASTGQLTLGTGSASGVATLTKAGADGELAVTSALVANGDARIQSTKAARLASVTSRTGAVSVAAVGDATGGTLRADAGDVIVAGSPSIAFDTLSANGNVRADAGSVLVGRGVAERGDLTLRASIGRLTLGSGGAGGVATLNKIGAAGELAVTGALVSNGDARIESASAARLASVTSRTGAVSVAATGEATGGVLRADAGDVAVVAGPLAAFDTLSANANVRADAGSVLIENGVTERGDLTLRASVGQLTLGTGSAGGIATLAKGGDAGALQIAGLLTAGDVGLASDTQARIGEAVSRAGDVRVSAATGILGADGVGGATLRAGRDIVAAGGALARLATVEAGRDVSVVADAVEIADASGRDFALRGGAGVMALGTIRARDDIVVRAAGPVAATALRAGGEGAVDADGVADALAARTLVGNDIDVIGASLDIESVTAVGATSDLRLAATQGRLWLGDADIGGAVDLTADGPDGELELPGTLAFAGDASFTTTRSFRFGAIASRLGSLRISAGGDVVGDRLASDAGDVVVDAGALASIGSLVAARDGTVRAESLRLDTGVVGRDLLLLARSGPLTLGRGDAGGTATLIKDGAAGDLTVTQAVVAGAGDALLTSSTNIRAGRVESAGGGVALRAANGDVTGIGDGRLDIAALGAGRDAAVRAGGVARLGAVAAARDVVVAAGRIDLTSAAARDIALEATDAATAETLRARDDIAVRAAGAIAIGDAAAGAGVSEDGAADALAGLALAGNDLDAQGGALSAGVATAAGDVRLTALTGSLAAGSVSGAGGVTLAKRGADGVLGATGPIAAGGDVAIRSTTDVRIAGVTSDAGSVAVDAAREVRGGDLSAANGSIGIRAGTALALNGVAAGINASAAADAVEIGSATATRGALTLLARAGDLSIGSASAAAGMELTKQGDAGELRATGALAADGDVALRSSANIRVAGVTSRAGALVVDAARDARGVRASATAGSVTLRAGSTLAFDDVSAGTGISSAADAVAIGAAVASGGALDLLVRAGDLSLGGGAADGGATLTKQGATGELRVSGALAVGGDVAIRSATDVRVAGVTSRAGNLLVDATRNARGDSLSAAGGSISARAGSTLAFGEIAAGGDASGEADVVAVGTATATRGALGLLARTGDLSLGSGTAATGLALAKQGATGELRVSGALAAGGDVAVRSATDIRVAGVTSRAGNLLVDATRNARGDALTTPNGSIVARAGSALAFDTLGAGAGITGAADAVDVGTATATRGALDLLARAGDLSLARGVAGTTATLIKQGATGQLRVSGSLAGQGDVNATSSTDARLANASSETGRLAVTAAGDVTGATPGTGGADLRAARGGIVVTSGGAVAQLGTVSAGPTLTVRANDLELLGLATAERVEIVNAGGRGGTRLGDDLPPAAGLNLRQAELDRIATGSLVVQGGARDMELGTLAFSARTGSNAIALLTTGRVDVTGAVSAAGAPNAPLRAVRIGGDAANGLATTLRVASTATGGGRLDFANTALDLRAARIGVGQDLLFLETIGLAPGGAPLPVSAVTARYISNPSSTLYVAARPYALTDGQPAALISASTLSLRFTDYALVQNTAATAASPGGLAIGGAGVPAPFLTLSAGGDTGANALALFGTINGLGGQQAALLGPDSIALNGVNRANSRINGCPVGAGGEGCLAANVFTTTTTEPEEEDDVVITVADEQPLALDAPVGASNEALIIGVGAGDRQGQPDADNEGAGPSESAGGARPL